MDSQSSEHSVRPSALGWAFILASAALSVLALVLIATNRVTLGAPGEWVWEYVPTGRWAEIWSPMLAFAVFMILAWLIQRQFRHVAPTRFAEVTILVVLLVAHGLMQMNVGFLGKVGLHDYAALTMTPWANGYYSDAIRTTSMSHLLRNYGDVMPTLAAHSRTHPPGPILFFWSFNAFYERFPAAADGLLAALGNTSLDPAGPIAEAEKAMRHTFSAAQKAGAWTASLAMPLAFALTLFPLYVLARVLMGHHAALWSLFLLAVLPSGLFFTPVLDQAYALPTTLAVCLFWHGLSKRRIGYAIGAGVVLSACLLMSLSFAAVVGLLFIMAAGYVLPTVPDADVASHRRWALRASLSLLLGIAVPLLAFQALTGFNVLEVFGKLLRIASQSTRDQYDGRVAVMTYSNWIWWNLADVVLFAGIPAALLYVKGWFRLARRMLATRTAPPEAVFHLAFLLTLLILNFSGVTLGEVARLWIMYMPFLLLLAARELVALGFDRSPAAFVLLALQFAHAVVFKLSFSWI